jgi:hypothetical protein
MQQGSSVRLSCTDRPNSWKVVVPCRLRIVSCAALRRSSASAQHVQVRQHSTFKCVSTARSSACARRAGRGARDVRLLPKHAFLSVVTATRPLGILTYAMASLQDMEAGTWRAGRLRAARAAVPPRGSRGTRGGGCVTTLPVVTACAGPHRRMPWSFELRALGAGAAGAVRFLQAECGPAGTPRVASARNRTAPHAATASRNGSCLAAASGGCRCLGAPVLPARWRFRARRSLMLQQRGRALAGRALKRALENKRTSHNG